MTGSRGLHRSPRTRPPVWLLIVAASFALYFLLLVVSNVRRPAPTGLLVHFDGGGVVAADVRPDSVASRAGVRAGDRIVRYAGRAVRTRLDWLSVDANLAPGQRIDLVLARGDQALQATLEPEGWFVRFPPRRDSVALGIALLGQFLTLLLAGLLVLRRPHDRLALLGACLLASFGVFTVVLPAGFAYHWRLMPVPVQWLLWMPFVSGAACGLLFFAFCAAFPQRVLRPAVVAAWSVPAIAALAWHVHLGVVVLRQEARAPVGSDWSGVLIIADAAYLAAGLALLASQHRRLEQPSERRRLRLLLAGCIVGGAAGLLVAAEYWLRPTPELTSSLFGSPITLIGVPLLLAVPASIAYTILWHRLFDVSLIIRRGVRYALARRLLVSLAPVLLAWLAADLLSHGREPLLDVLQSRGGRYAVLTALLVAVLVNRDRWLDALDRRFFHARYRADHILRDVAGQLRQSADPHAAVATVVGHVHDTLHPRFIVALGRDGDEAEYASLAAAPPGAVPPALNADSRVVALARALGTPLDLSPDHDEWIDAHLPADEAEAIAQSDIELLVPIVVGQGREVLLVLGPRRSEEPYAREDVALLEAIAASLSLVLERAPVGSPVDVSLAECPVCGACFDTDRARCPSDHALLVVSDLPSVLAGRYRLTARIGAGGMGTVYSAEDELLRRTVAVKVVADHLVGSFEAASRFQREAQTAAGFEHPNAVAIHDFGVTGTNRAFLVMERLEGDTLRSCLAAGGPLTLGRTRAIVGDLCRVLEAAHARGLVHRDLKPENIFLARVSGADVAKLLDFGIAKALGTPGGTTHVSTATGVLVGSLPYMAPEQLRGEPVDPSWDLWALAVTAHEMLTGRRPSHVLTVAHSPVSGDGRGQPPLPAALRDFFAAALAEDRAARPQTAAAFRDALATALESVEAGV